MARLLALYLFSATYYLPIVTAAYNGTTAACQQLKSSWSNVTFSANQSQYTALSTENWSHTAWQHPTCIVQPVDNAELQKVVEILTKTHTRFAIRSGGHSPSPYAANINAGVLIDMTKFNKIDYQPTQNVVTVGTGNRWGDVYHHLDKYNVTVVGGRVLDVGVGGLTLGCGLSYLSDLHGLVCDKVVKYEVVLANASIVEASADANQDLFRALKGGGNNFGIVTAFTFSTYPIQQVWGGIKTYSLEQLPALFSAVHEYQSVAEKDPYANLMLQAFTTNASVGGVLNMVYLKPEPSPQAFAPFYSIPTTGDTTKIQSLTQMMSGQRVPALPRWDWFATSFKTGSAALYQKIANIVVSAPELQAIGSVPAGSLALGVQPISSSAVLSTNSLGLQPVNQTWFVLDAGWWRADGDQTMHAATRGIINRIAAAAREEGVDLEYEFMNDASYDQDVIGSYGPASVRRLRKVQRRYDPHQVFERLVRGGFKIP